MPIYEFYCARCHTVYSFLSRTAGATKRPACPRCGLSDLERRVSAFAISKGRKEPAGQDGMPDLDDSRIERAMDSLASEAMSLDDQDAAGAARFMRRLYETAGLDLGAGMAEALRRMEAGEDPEAIEQEMGDVLEDDPLAGRLGEKEGALRLRRRLLPPRVDPELHEL